MVILSVVYLADRAGASDDAVRLGGGGLPNLGGPTVLLELAGMFLIPLT